MTHSSAVLLTKQPTAMVLSSALFHFSFFQHCWDQSPRQTAVASFKKKKEQQKTLEHVLHFLRNPRSCDQFPKLKSPTWPFRSVSERVKDKTKQARKCLELKGTAISLTRILPLRQQRRMISKPLHRQDWMIVSRGRHVYRVMLNATIHVLGFLLVIRGTSLFFVS